MSKTHIPQPETWLTDYGDMFYRYALVRVRSESIAEDLVQDTLLAGIQSFENYKGQSTVKTWLTGILKHKIIDHFRSAKHQSVSLDESELGDDLLSYQFDDQGNWKTDLVEWVTPDQSIDNDQFWQVFNSCIDRLPNHLGDLFILRTLHGLSSDDCCKIMGHTSTNQLWVALSRIRMKLRLCLETRWFNHE